MKSLSYFSRGSNVTFYLLAGVFGAITLKINHDNYNKSSPEILILLLFLIKRVCLDVPFFNDTFANFQKDRL